MNVVKKWVGLGLAPTLTGMTILIVTISTQNIWYAIGGFVLTTLLGIVLGGLIIRNPFSQMLEGQGILTFNISSTGIIDIFISQVRQPYIENQAKGMTDIFDRETVFNLSPPVSGGVLNQNQDGTLSLTLTKDDYNRAKFGMQQYPCLIYNSQMKSLITKDYLSEQEKITFSEHSIIYQNQKLHELTSQVRDFGRYIVELTKPNTTTSIFHNKWFWIIIAIACVVILALFAPSIFTAVKGGVANAKAGLAPASQIPQVITPR